MHPMMYSVHEVEVEVEVARFEWARERVYIRINGVKFIKKGLNLRIKMLTLHEHENKWCLQKITR